LIEGASRGGSVEIVKIQNFTFSFGCHPGTGVSATTLFAQNFIEFFNACFDVKTGSVDIPSSFSDVISADANLESITSDLSQELRISRKDNVVGSRFLIFVSTPSSASDEKFQIILDFFTETLGFMKSDIVRLAPANFSEGVQLDDDSKAKI
jgi:hypothetical protein